MFGWGWLIAMGSATAAPFPADDAWVWLSLTDPGADHGDASQALDIVGDTEAPLLAWYADDTEIFFRMRLGGDPSDASAQWTLLVDNNSDPLDFEMLVLVSGGTFSLDLLANTASADGVWVDALDTVDPLGFGDRSTGAVRLLAVDSTAPEGQWFLDLQLSRVAFETYLSPSAATPLRIALATSRYWPLGTIDVAGCDPDVADCSLLSPALSEIVMLDGDLDGLTDPMEIALGTDRTDADTDDDGIPDGAERTDVLMDGTIDALQCDSDGDGLADGTEIGISAASPATSASARCFIADADVSTLTDPNNADSDGGGLLDGLEDANGDGQYDPWETDPLDPTDDPDADGDGVPDLYDELFGSGPDTDSDLDGIDDIIEGLGDSDGDDTPDFADLDSDNDGLLDAEEGAVDTDGGGAMDFRDTDSDNDGISDTIEGLIDTDSDGIEDFRDLDSDGDGLEDADEGAIDTDLDGIENFRDLDADDDGIEDAEEGLEDTDGDGLPDAIDLDSDNDGVPDAVEGVEDTDDDDIPDRLDTDSDNDGLLDSAEGETDADCDGIIDRLDGDSEDGFCDTSSPPPVGDGVPPALLPSLTDEQPSGCGCQHSPAAPFPLLSATLALMIACRRSSGRRGLWRDKALP